ncbi:MAG: hypothetical protein ACPLXM_07700 [Bacteroidales bacterium]
MFRSHRILFVWFIFFECAIFAQTGTVQVKMDVPESVTAGNSFIVKISFIKGSLQGFCRFIQDLPSGLQAVSINPANSDFSFQDKRVRLIWFRLPETDTFSVLYSVKVDQRVKGRFRLGGTFSYVDNNERKSIKILETEVNIIPSPSINPGLVVDINDFGKKATSVSPASSYPKVFCLRNVIPSENLPGEKIVTVLIYKYNLASFGKLEDTIPSGYSAFAMERKDGLFTFRNGLAKYLWINLPSDPWFMISYRITPIPGVPHDSAILNGTFSYTSQNRTIVVSINETSQPLAKMDRTEVSSFVDALVSDKETLLLASGEKKSDGRPLSQTSALVERKEHVKKGIVVVSAETELAKIKENKEPIISPVSDRNVSVTLPAEFILLPEKGTYFRVQIAATRKVVSLPHHFRAMQITDEVRVELLDNWYKYTVGSFHSYEEAKKCRDRLGSLGKVKDPFIIAYRDGKRIPLQEATDAFNISRQ